MSINQKLTVFKLVIMLILMFLSFFNNLSVQFECLCILHAK